MREPFLQHSLKRIMSKHHRYYVFFTSFNVGLRKPLSIYKNLSCFFHWWQGKTLWRNRNRKKNRKNNKKDNKRAERNKKWDSKLVEVLFIIYIYINKFLINVCYYVLLCGWSGGEVWRPRPPPPPPQYDRDVPCPDRTCICGEVLSALIPVSSQGRGGRRNRET